MKNWAVAEGSTTVHLYPGDPTPRRGQRSGPRAVCKRYPMRGVRTWWWSMPVDEWSPPRLGHPHGLKVCPDCMDLM